MRRSRLAVLISGRGRNLMALHAAIADGRIDAYLVGVISNRADAAGLAWARAQGLHTVVLPHAAYPDRAAFDVALAEALHALRPDVIALAGFMRILGAPFVRAFEGRLLNVHPSLLPRHRGIHTHAAALAAGDAEHGATVHYVTPELDGGPLVIQGRFTLNPETDAESLAQQVLETIELRIFPQAVAWACRGELRMQAGQAWLRGQPLAAPLGLDALEPEFRCTASSR